MSYFTLKPSVLSVQIQRILERVVTTELYTTDHTHFRKYLTDCGGFRRGKSILLIAPNRRLQVIDEESVYFGSESAVTYMSVPDTVEDACGNVVQIDTDGDMLTFYTTETSNETLHLKSDITDY